MSMQNTPNKPCKHCSEVDPTHWPYQCFKNPKQRKTPKTMGKYTKQWIITRKTWIRNNPPDDRGYYKCYLNISPFCPSWMLQREMTLDHVIARSRDASKRYAADNLRPACYPCNTLKGSQSVDKFL